MPWSIVFCSLCRLLTQLRDLPVSKNFILFDTPLIQHQLFTPIPRFTRLTWNSYCSSTNTCSIVFGTILRTTPRGTPVPHHDRRPLASDGANSHFHPRQLHCRVLDPLRCIYLARPWPKKINMKTNGKWTSPILGNVHPLGVYKELLPHLLGSPSNEKG